MVGFARLKKNRAFAARSQPLRRAQRRFQLSAPWPRPPRLVAHVGLPSRRDAIRHERWPRGSSSAGRKFRLTCSASLAEAVAVALGRGPVAAVRLLQLQPRARPWRGISRRARVTRPLRCAMAELPSGVIRRRLRTSSTSRLAMPGSSTRIVCGGAHFRRDLGLRGDGSRIATCQLDARSLLLGGRRAARPARPVRTAYSRTHLRRRAPCATSLILGDANRTVGLGLLEGCTPAAWWRRPRAGRSCDM